MSRRCWSLLVSSSMFPCFVSRAHWCATESQCYNSKGLCRISLIPYYHNNTLLECLGHGNCSCFVVIIFTPTIKENTNKHYTIHENKWMRKISVMPVFFMLLIYFLTKGSRKQKVMGCYLKCCKDNWLSTLGVIAPAKLLFNSCTFLQLFALS